MSTRVGLARCAVVVLSSAVACSGGAASNATGTSEAGADGSSANDAMTMDGMSVGAEAGGPRADAAADAPVDGTVGGPSDAAIDTSGDADQATDSAGEAGLATTDGLGADAGGPAHAYVANFDNGGFGSLVVYDRPLSASSTPSLTLTSVNGVNAPDGVRLDPSGTKLWVSDSGAGKINAYALPLTATSQPAISLTGGANPGGGLAFDSAGDLWVAEFSGRIEEWTAPIAGGASAKTLHTGGNNVFAVAFDSNGALYAAGPPATTDAGAASIYVFAHPGTDTSPGVANGSFGGNLSALLIVGGSKLYTASYVSEEIGYTTLPLTAQSTFTQVTTTIDPEDLRLSPAGQLVVVNGGVSRSMVSFFETPSVATLDFGFTNGLVDSRSLEYGP